MKIHILKQLDAHISDKWDPRMHNFIDNIYDCEYHQNGLGYEIMVYGCRWYIPFDSAEEVKEDGSPKVINKGLILILPQLKKHIDSNQGWDKKMYDLIGKKYEYKNTPNGYNIEALGYSWYIPFDSAEIVSSEEEEDWADDYLGKKWNENLSQNWWDNEPVEIITPDYPGDLSAEVYSRDFKEGLELFYRNGKFFGKIVMIKYNDHDGNLYYFKDNGKIFSQRAYQLPSLYKKEERNFEDLLLNDIHLDNKVLRFAEYRKGSAEYGQLLQDLMMLLRLKKEQDKEADEIILTRKDLKNIEFDKLLTLVSDVKKMRKLGMSFDVDIMDNGHIKFSNLGNKESRPWENNDPLNEGVISDLFNKYKDKINSFIDKKIASLSQSEIEEIKLELLPYKNLSLGQIRNKLKRVNEKVDNIHKSLDPYGEEDWDENEVDVKERERRVRKKTRLLNMFRTWTIITLVQAVI